MKIEKVNDNQIRCTLTKEDLDDRQLKISEIAYGSEKAKLLFRDMMQQANYEYGFEAEDIPLMIEAIPMSSGCIVFIITKVEDPEELDTRFSKFAPSVHEDDEYEDDDDIYEQNDFYPPAKNNTLDNTNASEKSHALQNAIGDFIDHLTGSNEDVFDLFRKISNKKGNDNNNSNNNTSSANKNNLQAPVSSSGKNLSVPRNSGSNKANEKNAQEPISVRLFSFGNLDDLANVAHVISDSFSGGSALYKNKANNRYYLLLVKNDTNPKEFIRICNLLMEYGSPENCTAASIAYMDEHYSMLLANNAIASLSQI